MSTKPENTEKKAEKNVKALLLVGGFGTRLRPLTFTKAKPLIEFINKPILVHQIEALKKVGVNEVILAINYSSEGMFKYLQEYEKKYQIKITCSKEDIPLGTAGPIGLAKSYLKEADEIFIFNADVTCQFPLRELYDFHLNHGKEGTITTTTVKEPSRYGVIITDEENKILQFVEKPKDYVGNRINAGLYIFSKKFLDRVEAKPTSIEREVFPKMAADGQLYAYPLQGFWADIGKPDDFLNAVELYLNEALSISPDLITPPCEKKIGKNVCIDKSATIEEGCFIGPNCVIGAGCVIKKGVRIKNSVLLQNVVVGENSYIEKSIIGWKSKIGKWCRIQGLSVFGEDVTINDELLINKNFILPNLTIKASPKEGDTIMC